MLVPMNLNLIFVRHNWGLGIGVGARDSAWIATPGKRPGIAIPKAWRMNEYCGNGGPMQVESRTLYTRLSQICASREIGAGAVRHTDALANHPFEDHGIGQLHHFAGFLGDDVADRPGHAVAAAAMQGHLGVERQPAVSPPGVQGRPDFGRALDLDQFPRLEVQCGTLGFLLLARHLIEESPAAQQPPHTVQQCQPKLVSKATQAQLARAEIVKEMPKRAGREIPGGRGQLGRLAVEAVALRGG